MYNGVNHLAFITNDMNKTVRFYRDLMGFPLVAGIGTQEFKHYFFQITPHDAIAFFAYDQAAPMEIKHHGVPTSKPLGFDHVSIGVNTKADLFTVKDRVEAAGFTVTGPVDHGIGWSIYFFDNNGIRLEITTVMDNEDFDAVATVLQTEKAARAELSTLYESEEELRAVLGSMTLGD